MSSVETDTAPSRENRDQRFSLSDSRRESQGRRRIRLAFVIGLLLVGGLVVALLSLMWGTPAPSASEVLGLLSGTSELSGNAEFIVNNLRLPRVIAAVIAGAMLGAAGAVMQDALRNPLAGPELIGVSAGASLAVAIVVAFRIPLPASALPIPALLAGLAAGGVILGLVSLKGDPLKMLLVGAAFTALLNALVVAVITLAPNFAGVSVIYRFLVGSLSGVGWEEVELVLPWLVFLVIVFVFAGRPLNILKLGDDVAEGLGVGVRKTRALLFAGSVFLVAPVVAIAGPIAFIALVAPHITRRLLVTADAKLVVPVSSVVGATLVLAADMAARLVFHPHEMAVGLWTVAFGAPVLLFLMQRGIVRRRTV